jgi:hypothetical protein
MLGVWALCALVVVPEGSGWADPADPHDLTGQQILDRVAEVYARCASYRDSGVVKTIFIEAFGKRTVEKPFTTAFVRPNHFRFEYYEKGQKENRFVIWCNGKEVQTWWGIQPGVERSSSLSAALAAATGVSSGSARRIPGLLLADPIGAGWDIRRLQHLERLGDAKLRGADCMLVRGETGVGRHEPVVLWIAKFTFLIRRIEEQNTFDDFRTEETTTYEPRINGQVPDRLLEFDRSTQK